MDNVQAVINAINEISSIREYDYAMLAIAASTFVASTLIAYFTYKINKRQTKILADQNKLGLFDKRYKYYQLSVELHRLFNNYYLKVADSFPTDNLYAGIVENLIGRDKYNEAGQDEKYFVIRVHRFYCEFVSNYELIPLIFELSAEETAKFNNVVKTLKELNPETNSKEQIHANLISIINVVADANVPAMLKKGLDVVGASKP